MSLLDDILLAAVILLLVSGFNPSSAEAPPAKDQRITLAAENAVTLTVEQRAVCEAGGGCALVTGDQILEALQKAYTKGRNDSDDKGAQSCTRPA